MKNNISKRVPYFVSRAFSGGTAVVLFLFTPLPKLSLLSFALGLLFATTMLVENSRGNR